LGLRGQVIRCQLVQAPFLPAQKLTDWC
jgi:hypothetical protein